MNAHKIPHTDLKVSRIAYGCMGIGGRWNREPITAHERRAAIDLADGVELSRREWYQLFVAARGAPMP